MTHPTLRVGDSVAFTVSRPSEAGRTLRRVYAGASNFEIVATESLIFPGEFVFAASSFVSSSWAPGSYFWHELSELAGDRRTLDSGQTQVLPDITAVAAPFDARTYSRRMVDAIEATLEGRVTKDVESYQIRGRSLTKIPVAELIVLRDKFKLEARREDIAAGLIPARRLIKTVFVR